MNSEQYCNNINSKLSQLVVEVRTDSASNLRSKNIHAEGFFREFLNVLFGWKLSNANAVVPNAAGIDLCYTGTGGTIVVQVSSTFDHGKIQSSLKKSERFKGAHFYFVAITDKLPNYTKSFDTYGLDFDPNTDILNTPRLHERVVHCEGRGELHAIDIQRELSELVNKHFAQEAQRTALALQPLGRNTPLSLFEYNANAVPLLGRAEELKTLRRFVTEQPERCFLWWAVAGPGAAGKTRLAYELQEQLLREGVWDVRVLSSDVLEQYKEKKLSAAALSDLFPGNTLLLVDYVQQHADTLARLLPQLSEINRSAPLRLLLLERDVRDKDGRIPWFNTLLGTDHHVRDALYEQKLLLLSSLKAADGTADPLQELIRRFADTLCAQPAPDGAPLHPLPAGKEAYLRERLEAIDPGLLRPLFAMILADAWVRDPNTEHWTREELLSHIVARERSLLAGRLRPFHAEGDNNLPKSARLIWTVATVLGAGGAPLHYQSIQELLPWDWETVTEAASEHKKVLRRRDAEPEEALLDRAGLLAEGQIPPLRPDLLGEFFVLDTLGGLGNSERKAFWSAVLSEPDAALTFFGRVLNDYGAYLLEQSNCWDTLFPEHLKTDDPERMARYARLLRTLFDHSLDRNVRSRLCGSLNAFAAQQTGETTETARIYNDTASVLRNMGDYPRALDFYQKAIIIRERVLGTDHPDTATTYNNIAGVYKDKGDFDRALTFYQKALAIRERVLGADHPDTATTYNDIALVYQAKGDFDQALAFFLKAIAIHERVLGADHPDTATSYNNIAGVYRAKSDFDRALAFFQKALAIRERVLGADHPSTATTYNNVAEVYRAKGDFDRALAFLKKALAIRERVLGMDHPDTAFSYGNIALVYQDKGDFDQALTFYQKDLAISERVLGADHPDTATSYNNIALVYQDKGDLDRALAFHNKALAIQERVLGTDHPDTATTYNNIAGVYQDKGDFDRALAFYQKDLAITERVLGADHPSTATSYNNIALVYKAMGDFDRALPFYQKALAIRERVLGADHPSTAITCHNLSMLYLQTHDLANAVQYSDRALRMFQRVLGPEHPYTKGTGQMNDMLKKLSELT